MKSQHKYFAIFISVLISSDLYGVTKNAPIKSTQPIVYGQAGITSFQLDGNNESTTANSYRGGYNHFVSPNISLHGGYYSVTALQTGKTLLSGFDVGSRLYLFSPGVRQKIRTNNILIETSSEIMHYLNISYVQRTLSIGDNQLGYSGYGLGYGLSIATGYFLDISFLKEFNINIEVQSEQLSAFESPSATATNLLVGIEIFL